MRFIEFGDLRGKFDTSNQVAGEAALLFGGAHEEDGCHEVR